jgi:hypothetical protein
MATSEDINLAIDNRITRQSTAHLPIRCRQLRPRTEHLERPHPRLVGHGPSLRGVVSSDLQERPPTRTRARDEKPYWP